MRMPWDYMGHPKILRIPGSMGAHTLGLYPGHPRYIPGLGVFQDPSDAWAGVDPGYFEGGQIHARLKTVLADREPCRGCCAIFT